MPSPLSTKKFLDRKLPERSFIDFEFPSGKLMPAIRLPFFENIGIQESNVATLATHKPIGRNSPLFSYTGAGPKKLKLQFQLTMPLLIEQALSISKYIQFSAADSKYEKRKAFFSIANGSDLKAINGEAATLINEYIGSLTDSTGRDYISSFLRNNPQLNGEEIRQIIQDHNSNPFTPNATINTFRQVTGFLDKAFNSIGNLTDNAIDKLSFGLLPATSRRSPELLNREEVINIILWWVQVIRASVLNNAQEPVYGPPILRLTHGILYRSVPFVCNDYSLDYDMGAGFDVKTLLPRRISVNMNLLEVRAGDFGKFEAGHPIKRDNVVGWEALFKDGHSLDPQPVSVISDVENDSVETLA